MREAWIFLVFVPLNFTRRHPLDHGTVFKQQMYFLRYVNLAKSFFTQININENVLKNRMQITKSLNSQMNHKKLIYIEASYCLLRQVPKEVHNWAFATILEGP